MNHSNNYDELLDTIANYVCGHIEASDEAYQTARLCLADALGCAALAMKFPDCTRLLGPILPGTSVPYGSRVPGTAWVLDPIRAAFSIGTLIRWLDYNDTWLAKEWGHPSDNLGGILAIMDHLSQKAVAEKNPPLTVRQILRAMIQAYEIQGVLALGNSFNHAGLDHVILVKVATAAVVTFLLGGQKKQVLDALTQAWVDLGPLRAYRHAPNTGSRKSWAAGDATSRGVFFAWLTMQGEMGYPSVLTTPKWGVEAVLFQGQPLTLSRALSCYVMENILFKVAYPAEFHAQTAVECAVLLHPEVKDRLDDIESIEIVTHESALRIIDKKGPLNNYADRDHCIQYMVAVALIHGTLKAHHYHEETAFDPQIDMLRNKMQITESPTYSKDYLDPDKRSIANSLTIHMKDGQVLGPIAIEYPLGHRKRRAEGTPLLFDKFHKNLESHYPTERVDVILSLFHNSQALDMMPVQNFMELFVER